MSDSRNPPRRAFLVTGGARRVGAAIVRRLHADGADVVIHFRSSALAADEVADELNARRPGSAQLIQGDLNRLDRLDAFASDAVARFGRLDGLVNNASSFYPTPLGQIGEDDYEDLLGSNFRAPLFLTQYLAGELRRRQGVVVNIIDIHAERPLQGYPLYSAAKGALATLTRALAVEMAPAVRVNGVAPGPIDWPEDAQFDEAARQAIVAHTLLKRVGRAEEIAAAVAFLAGEASYVTGQILNVDGGRSVHL